MSDERFRAKSPNGYIVICLKRQWEHISEGHSIMKNNESAIIEAIEDPEYIYKDQTYPDKREVYYGKSSQSTYDSNKLYTKVVVNIPDDYNEEGDVVTAWPTPKIKEKEEGKKYDKRSIGQGK